MSDDSPYLSYEDDPAPGTPPAGPYVNFEDEHPNAAPPPLRAMPNPTEEADYQGWVNANLHQPTDGTTSPVFHTPSMGDRTVTVDPSGNGVDADLRSIFKRYAPEVPIPQQRTVDVTHAMLDEYQTQDSPKITADSVYSKGLPKENLGSWNDDHTEFHPAGWQPASTTQKIMSAAAKTASDAYDSASKVFDVPAGSKLPVLPIPSMDDTAAAVGDAATQTVKGFARGTGRTLDALNYVAAQPGGVPWMYDQAKSLLSGQDTTEAEDWLKDASKTFKNNEDAYAVAKSAGLPGDIADAVGETGAAINQALLMGPAKAIEASTSALNGVIQTLSHTAQAAVLPAVSSAVETGRNVYEKTGDAGAAVKAAQAQYLVTMLQFAAPVSMEGKLATRVASGAAISPVTSEVGRQAMNVALPTTMQTEYEPKQSGLAALTGGLLAAGAGHARPEAPVITPEAPGEKPFNPEDLVNGPAPAAPFDRGASYQNYEQARRAATAGDTQSFDFAHQTAQAHAEAAEAYAKEHPSDASAQADAKDARTMAGASFWSRYRTEAETNGKPNEAKPEPAPQEEQASHVAGEAADAGEIKVEPAAKGAVVSVKGQAVLHVDDPEEAQQIADIAKQRVDERRTDVASRTKVDQMTPEQMRAELLTHPLTGIANRRAWDEMDKGPAQAMIDADGLKYINDEGGHAAGDRHLKAIADALQTAMPGQVAHFGGDEFAAHASSNAELDAGISRAKGILSKAQTRLTHPDGSTTSFTGIGFSHGTGSTLDEADRNLAADKQARTEQGLRAARGQPPVGSTRAAPQAGLSGDEGAGAATGRNGQGVLVLGQRVQKPAAPTPAQKLSGGYFKPTVQFHGMPIRVENVSGQYRSGTDSDGHAWKSRMKGTDYGYFEGTRANDGDGVDVFMGKKPDTGKAYVIDQLDKTGKKFDEHKVVVGVGSEQEAMETYLKHYEKGWKGFGGVTELPVEQLKQWLAHDDHTQPLDPESVPREKIKRGLGPDPRHDSVLEYLARHSKGLDSEEASRQGIDKADMGLAAAHVGIRRAFRKSGMSFDHAAETLHQEGYPVGDEHGHYNPNTLLDRIDEELRGRKVYSTRNVSATPERPETPDWLRTHSEAELTGMSERALEELEARLQDAHDDDRTANERNPEHVDYIPFAKADEFSLTSPAGSAGAQPQRKKVGGEQQDLFGDKVAIANELAKVKAALDKKRNSGQASAETGKPGDLFSQSRKQTELETRGSAKLNLPTKQEIAKVLAEHPLVGYKGKITRAYLVGSFAKDLGNKDSDVDVLLEVPRVPGKTPVELEEKYRQKIRQYFVTHDIRGKDDSVHPQWDGRRVDVYFTYDADQETRPKIRLQNAEAGAEPKERSLPALRIEYRKLKDEQDRQYHVFSRTARGKPVDPAITRRMVEIEKIFDKSDETLGGKQSDLAEAADNLWSPLEPAELLARSIPELREYIEGAKLGGHAAEVKEAERIIAIHEDQARVEKEYADRRPITEYGKSLLERVAAVEKTLGIEKPKDVATDLVDTGEKIGGARKDKWRERGLMLSDLKDMSAGEAANLVTKQAIWKPDYEAMINGGADVRAAALIKGIYDKLGAKPRENTPVGREHYVEAMQALRKIAEGVKTKEDAEDVQDKFLAAIGYDRSKPYYAAKEGNPGYPKFWSIHKGNKGVLDVRYKQMSEADKLIAKGWPNIEPWQRRFNIRQDGSGNFHVMAKTSYKSLGNFPTKAEAETFAKAQYEAIPAGEKKAGPPPRPHLTTIKRTGPQVRTGDAKPIDFIDDFGFRGIEFGNWAANDERQMLVNHAYEALHDLARTLNLPPKALSLGGKLGLALGARGGGFGVAHYEPGKLVINITKLHGAGSLAHEWGHAVDHYFGEYGKPDAYTTEGRYASGGYKDPNYKTVAHLRPEMQQAWQGVMKAIFQRDLTQAEHLRGMELSNEKRQATIDQQKQRQAQAEGRTGTRDEKFIRNNAAWIVDAERSLARAKQTLEERRAAPEEPGTYGKTPTRYLKEAEAGGDYWRRPTEMLARAFESFVQDRLEAKGEQSQYLVHSTVPADPYPGEDRPAINAALQNLVDNFKTDNDVLFRRGEAGAEHLSVPEVRAAVDLALHGFGNKPDVTVVKSLEDLANHPDVGAIARHPDSADAVAFLHPPTKTIYMMADQIHSAEHAATVLAHEYVTHYGLRAAFGDRRDPEYQAILDGVAKAMPAETRKRGEQAFPGSYNATNRAHRNIGAEEALAYYGQRYAAGQSVPQRMKRWLDRMAGMIRDWVRKVLGLPKRFDELFIKRTLADLESFLRRRTQGNRAEETETGPAFAEKQDTFYSGLAKAVDGAKREKGTGAEWEATLRNMPGVKAEEMQWTGLKDWLEGRGRVTKDEVADYVNAHRVQLGEVEHGGRHAQELLDDGQIAELKDRMAEAGYDDLDPEQVQALERGGQDTSDMLEALHRMGIDASDMYTDAPKYASHATPGGENYRELLMTLPPKAPTPEVLAARKAVFERHQSRLDEIDRLTDDYQYRGRGTAETIRDLNREHNALMRQRDAEADAVGKVEPLPMYKSAHWDEANVLAHIRFDDRTGPNGEKILHVHEVQSDWHQTGRKSGYRSGNMPDKAQLERARNEAWEPAVEAIKRNDKLGFDSARDALNGIYSEGSNWMNTWPDVDPADVPFIERWRSAAAATIRADVSETQAVPDAPFKTTWPELAMKRMLRYAAEKGYDKLSWDTGSTNAERYNMQQVADRITIVPSSMSNGAPFTLTATKAGERVTAMHDLSEEQLVRYIGKDMTQKAISGQQTFEGKDLKIGGAGMRGFYDDILPKTVQKLVKKWGSSVEPGTVNGDRERVHYEGEAHSLTELKQIQQSAIRDRSWSGDDKQELQDVIRAMSTGDSFQKAVDEKASEGLVTRLGGKMVGTNALLPAHVVEITPQMRDSVMEGQAMFARNPKQGEMDVEQPREPETFLGKEGAAGSAYGLIRRGVLATVNNELTMSLRRILNPKDISDVSKRTAQLTSAYLGDLAQQRQRAQDHLEQFARAMDKLSPKDQLGITDAIERLKPQPIAGMQPAADAMRKIQDTWRDNVRALGTGHLENYIEGYMKHMWQDEGKAQSWIRAVMGRSPMRGPATFLKKRTIPYTTDGIAMGLRPVSYNPLVLTLVAVHEMQRYISGVTMMRAYKEAGLARFFPMTEHVPDGWKEINDPIARVSNWSEAEGGFIQRGRYAMPEDAARIINNHLGRSALADFAPAQVVRIAANIMNSMQLGFSAFHLGFTTLDAMVSKNALGIERLFHGEPVRAAAAFIEAATPAGAALNIRRGYKLLNSYLNPAGATPEMQQLVRGLSAGGGRVKMDRYFMAAEGASPFRGVGFKTLASDIHAAVGGVQTVKAIGNFPMEYALKTARTLQAIAKTYPFAQVPFEILGRVTRAGSSLIMEHVVPLQKLGVFSDMASDWFRRNPNGSPEEMTAAMQSIWRSVDNRLGEMVYDNKFWNRTFKDSMHLAVRAVGWNDGTLEEIGGAPVDVLKAADKLIRTGKVSADDWGHKAAYVMGLMMTQAMVGATLQYLMTGEGPRDLKDLAFPRTGRFHRDGTAERISLPSYVKDIYEYYHHPMQTLAHKANPWIGLTNDLVTNTDYFGHPLYNPNETSLEQFRDESEHVWKTFEPFSFSGRQQMEGAKEPGLPGAAFSAMPFVGLTPAPGYVTKPEKIAEFQHYQQEVEWQKKLRFDLKQAIAAGDKAKAADLRKQLSEENATLRRGHAEYLKDKAKSEKAARAGQTGALDTVHRLIEGSSDRAEMAQKVEQAGYPALAGLLRSLPATLRPAMQARLQEYA